MATIIKRGENQWLVRIRRKGHKPIARTFESYEDVIDARTGAVIQQGAKSWADITEGKISGQEYVDRSKEQRASLKILLERYLEEVTPTKKGAAQEAYRIKQWMGEPMANWSLPAVSSSDIAAWKNARVAEGKAPSTISNAMNLLSAVYKMAISEWGYRVTNPVQGVKRPKARKGRNARLSAAQEKVLLDACREGPSWLIWCTRIALTTAMRAGEIRRLRWEFISPKVAHLPETKNDEARDVPLTMAGYQLLREMRETVPIHITGWVFGDPDITTKREGGFTKDMVSQAFADAARKAGLEVTFHDLRHVAITRLQPLHKDALELSATTGHKSLSVLKRYYNPAPEDRADDIREREKKLNAKVKRATATAR